MKTVNEKFTDLADQISTWAGTWPVTAVSLLAICIWVASGPACHWSDSWQLWVNTPTTIIELFLGLFSLAATNRVQRHVMGLLEHMNAREDHIEHILEHLDGQAPHE